MLADGKPLTERRGFMKIEPKPSDREVLAGLVERVTYQNAENGFCVVRVRVRGHRELVTLEHSNTNGLGHQVMQEPQSLCRQVSIEKIDPGRVAARPCEAGDKTKPDRVIADAKDDRGRRGCSFGRKNTALPAVMPHVFPNGSFPFGPRRKA